MLACCHRRPRRRPARCILIFFSSFPRLRSFDAAATRCGVKSLRLTCQSRFPAVRARLACRGGGANFTVLPCVALPRRPPHIIFLAVDDEGNITWQRGEAPMLRVSAWAENGSDADDHHFLGTQVIPLSSSHYVGTRLFPCGRLCFRVSHAIDASNLTSPGPFSALPSTFSETSGWPRRRR